MNVHFLCGELLVLADLRSCDQGDQDPDDDAEGANQPRMNTQPRQVHENSKATSERTIDLSHPRLDCALCVVQRSSAARKRSATPPSHAHSSDRSHVHVAHRPSSMSASGLSEENAAS